MLGYLLRALVVALLCAGVVVQAQPVKNLSIRLVATSGELDSTSYVVLMQGEACLYQLNLLPSATFRKSPAGLPAILQRYQQGKLKATRPGSHKKLTWAGFLKQCGLSALQLPDDAVAFQLEFQGDVSNGARPNFKPRYLTLWPNQAANLAPAPLAQFEVKALRKQLGKGGTDFWERLQQLQALAYATRYDGKAVPTPAAGFTLLQAIRNEAGVIPFRTDTMLMRQGLQELFRLPFPTDSLQVVFAFPGDSASALGQLTLQYYRSFTAGSVASMPNFTLLFEGNRAWADQAVASTLELARREELPLYNPDTLTKPRSLAALVGAENLQTTLPVIPDLSRRLEVHGILRKQDSTGFNFRPTHLTLIAEGQAQSSPPLPVAAVLLGPESPHPSYRPGGEIYEHLRKLVGFNLFIEYAAPDGASFHKVSRNLLESFYLKAALHLNRWSALLCLPLYLTQENLAGVALPLQDYQLLQEEMQRSGNQP